MCGIVTYFGGAGNNLTRVLTGMASIIYRAPDSTGIAAFGDDTEPIRLRKAVGSMTSLIERLHQKELYPCPERHLATLLTADSESDEPTEKQKQLLVFEGLTLEYLYGIEEGSLSYLNFDDLVDLDPSRQKRLSPGWPGAPLSHPEFIVRSKKHLLSLIEHFVTEFDLSPIAIQFIIKDALQRTIEENASQHAPDIRDEDILRTFDEIYEKILAREKISPPRRLNYGFPTKSLYPHKYVWRYLIQSPIRIPSDYNRDGVRCVFRLLDAALLIHLPIDHRMPERLQQILDSFWPESRRPAGVQWRSLYATEKGLNVFGWAAATALTYLQREDFLPAFLKQMPGSQLLNAEAIVAGQTDPVSLRYFSQPVMAHGRWAIQSAVTEKNAHPFADARRQRVLVVNGQFDSQVEEQVRRFLEKVAGSFFRSENSAEYLALLWGYYAELLHKEQQHNDAIRNQVENGLEDFAIGTQAMDYSTYRQVQGKSTDQIDQLALIEAAERMCRNGGQLAAAAMSLRSPKKLYVVSHNRPVFIVHRLDNHDFMVVSDINAAMGLFPQELIQQKMKQLQTQNEALKADLEMLQSESASPEKIASRKARDRKERKALLKSFKVEVYPLEGERLFACIESVLAENTLTRRLSFTDFDGRPLNEIDPFTTFLNPVLFRRDFRRSFYETHLAEIPERLNEILRFYRTDAESLLDFGVRTKQLRRRFGRNFEGLKRIVLIGTGSAYNMARISRTFIKSLLPEVDILLLRPGETEDLSRVIVPERDLVLLLSWSSTTADMVKTARQLLDLHVVMVGITEKTFADMALIAYKSGGVVPMLSGEEITVSGVKSTVCMLFIVDLFCAWLAVKKGRLTEARHAVEALERIPNSIEELLQDKKLKSAAQQIAQHYTGCRAAVVIDALQCSGEGREIALKLEENSWAAVGKTLDYMEALPLIDRQLPSDALVIVNATCQRRLDEAVGIMERLHRHGTEFTAVSIAHRQQEKIEKYSSGRCIILERLPEQLQPFVDLTFYYQFALHFGLAQGREIGVPPRNRAKSITVSRSLKVNRRRPSDRLQVFKEMNQAAGPVKEIIRRAEKRSKWEDRSQDESETRYYRKMRQLAHSMASPSPQFSRLNGLDADVAERIRDSLFSDASDVEAIVLLPLERSAEAAARTVADQWRLLLDYPIFVMPPWEAAAYLPENALSIITGGPDPCGNPLEKLLANIDGPFIWAGCEPAGGIPAGSENCLARIDFAAASGLHNFNLIYNQLNELLIRIWQQEAPEKADVVEQHVQMSAESILAVLNDAALLDTIRKAMAANDAYETAFFVGPPNGIGLAWAECFDRYGKLVLEHHPYGHSAHGPLVTVDPRVDEKYVKLEPRDMMTARYGKSKVAGWEKACLGGTDIDTFLGKNEMSAPRDRRQPFFAAENWYLPILLPEYQTVEDNLIIMDTTSRMYFHQAVDECATFGCRYPRMITLSQTALTGALKDAAVFRFPISDLILVPGIEHENKILPMSELLLPYCSSLVAMAMARATRQQS